MLSSVLVSVIVADSNDNEPIFDFEVCKQNIIPSRTELTTLLLTHLQVDDSDLIKMFADIK